MACQYNVTYFGQNILHQKRKYDFRNSDIKDISLGKNYSPPLEVGSKSYFAYLYLVITN